MAVSLQQSLPEMAKIKAKTLTRPRDDAADDADDATTDRQSQQADKMDKICLIFKRKIRVVASLIT